VIFLDTNILAETMKPFPDRVVLSWLVQHDRDLLIPSIVIGEIAYGIRKLGQTAQAERLTKALSSWRERYTGRIIAFDEESAMVFGDLLGDTRRAGRPMSVPDAMIAATTIRHHGRLATRNSRDFDCRGLVLINPFDWLS
jgi:predicted nucleic acid-binding protein